MKILVSDVVFVPLLIISVWTFFLIFFTLRKLRDKRLKIMFTLLCLSIFVYSGYGIAYPEVDDQYLLPYIIFTGCFALPFLMKKNSVNEYYQEGTTSVDRFFESHISFLRICTLIYFSCLFIPLIYPEFKLFQIFQTGFSGLVGFYDLRVQYKSNALIGLVDTLRVFVLPFFFVYLTIIQEQKEKTRKPLILFLFSILFEYMRYAYMGRYQMVINALLIYVIIRCVKGYKFDIKIRQLAYICLGVILAIPFLYAFTFIRQGNSVEESGTFFDIAGLLIKSEAYYPIYYDHIISSPILKSQTPLTFILWLLFLPIPSAIWPNKPTLQSDAFTYSLTGMHYGDPGYSSSLTSVMGESFMYFGKDFYWVQALIMGFIMIYIIQYLIKHRSTNLLSLYLIVYVLAVGRGGAASYMSTIIFGALPIYIIDKFLVNKKI